MKYENQTLSMSCLISSGGALEDLGLIIVFKSLDMTPVIPHVQLSKKRAHENEQRLDIAAAL